MILGDATIQRFLAGRDVAVLATLQPDGAPLAMPMWFLAEGAAVTMLSVEDSQKVRNLRRDPRACVVVEASEPIRGVSVQGRAAFVADGPERRQLVERFHARYPGLQRIWGGPTMPPDRVMFRIAPTRVHAWGLT